MHPAIALAALAAPAAPAAPALASVAASAAAPEPAPLTPVVAGLSSARDLAADGCWDRLRASQPPGRSDKSRPGA